MFTSDESLLNFLNKYFLLHAIFIYTALIDRQLQVGEGEVVGTCLIVYE